MTPPAAAFASRFVRQPGPPATSRLVGVEGRGSAFSLRLPAGANLLEAVHRGFAAHGFEGGAVDLGAIALDPMAYVMPALSQTPEHAAYYSETFRTQRMAQLAGGALTLGRRDGRPFFHAHARWTEADGRESGGHLLPDETVVAQEADVTAFGFAGGLFQATVDPETNFKLFEPVPDDARPPGGSARAFALRVRPNEDLASAIEQFCRRAGVSRARIRGGVGSTIGARFVGGRTVENFATEVFLMQASVSPGAGGLPQAHLPAGLVDFTGALAGGVLQRGANPVLMTFELILEEC